MSAYGRVDSVAMPMVALMLILPAHACTQDRNSGLHRGFAYVEFAAAVEATKVAAIACLDAFGDLFD